MIMKTQLGQPVFLSINYIIYESFKCTLFIQRFVSMHHGMTKFMISIFYEEYVFNV